VLGALWEVFLANDATLLEVNPLVLTRYGGLIAADARLAIDDRAAEAHPEFARSGDRSGLTAYEREAADRKAVGVEMAGNLAIVTSGAGVMMATADSVRARGGRPGPLLDLGGFQRSVHEQAEVMRLVLAFAPDTVLVNLFTQVLRCDVLAQAMLLAFRDTGTPIVARLTGHMADRGAAILGAAGVPVSAAYGTACELAVASARARAGSG
jgi:succinyl-CoA synthetase beta subunit